MIFKLLTEHHLAFLSFKGGCTGSSESTLVKMSNCWKSHAAAHYYVYCWFCCPLQIDEDLSARINMADYKFSFHEKGKLFAPAWMAPEGLY